MSFVRLAFSSDRLRSLASLAPGSTGTVAAVRGGDSYRVDRLLGLGVTVGARVTVLQTFPGIVFLCDQTELAVERTVAAAILVAPSREGL